MNILFFMTPKQDIAYIYEDSTLRQALEKWGRHRYATIPVIKRTGEYVGSISEGDLLWGIKNTAGMDMSKCEDTPISSFARLRDYKAVPVTTSMNDLLAAAMTQNFVPVVDDRQIFIGMVRRQAILEYFYRTAKDRPELSGLQKLSGLFEENKPQ